MDTWKISGGESLFGSVRIPGAKNSARQSLLGAAMRRGRYRPSLFPNDPGAAACGRRESQAMIRSTPASSAIVTN